MRLSVIIPTLDAAARLPATLAALDGAPCEVIVADAGSTDGTAELAGRLGARVVQAPRGRGVQVAAGVAAARGEWLLLLHADTRLDPAWPAAVQSVMARHPDRAAYFRFVLDSSDPRARRLERVVAWRCRVWALPYGDQGLLISRRLLAAVGGVRPLPLMEDVDLVRRIGRPRLIGLDVPAVTSAERWQRDGWYRRSARNLCCLALYRAGLPLHLVARLYA
ncbi:TIGR04283 family arsenosugar biosynthesis glycosyltransferase [Limobrevibacterium gyesilva]|uniref:TIGR04283 family arsenosugar biosynthesis glycosyltransferase n=1 Tax=Limobrevibacterium gyesilva TaxID=2991712 RepID=A0AA41YPF9_9PROT|nr:TIGR04283 family arsenosugar biosynthesis glycosyltransferase [Limobrevibacterium gyesilva]MCW3473127.1 TIGR04283 family arsenosugar biosynthesis glycosyltransferase [Limobrevibacterium gyesilva]